MATPFETLNVVDVSEHTEKKKTGSTSLTYLSWSWAWAEVQKYYPNATYTIVKNDNGLPYVFDENTGYMVYTTVTIEGITHEMWLPVMDGANKAMKDKRYTYKVKDWKTKQYVEKTVEPATMFDINKTIMRCLVKNLAMFGLGLYIYSGEDLPTTEPEEEKPKPVADKTTEQVSEAQLRARVLKYINNCGMSTDNIAKLCRFYGCEKPTELSVKACKDYIAKVQDKGGDI